MRVIIALLLGTLAAPAATPVLKLAEEADLIVLGEVFSSESKEGNAALEIQVISTLKGEAPSPLLKATLRGQKGDPPPEGLEGQVTTGILGRGASPISWEGVQESHGLWFLKSEGDEYAVLPYQPTDYAAQEGFIALPKSWIPPEGNLSRQLLLSVQEFYQSHPIPRFVEALLSVSLVDAIGDDATRDDALDVVNTLRSSSKLNDRVVGVALGLQLNYEPALGQLYSELDSLTRHPKFALVASNLKHHYIPSTPSSMEALSRLIKLRSGAPGLDDAIGWSLRKVIFGWDYERGTSVMNQVGLRNAALLLESPDPQGKRTAAMLFHGYTAMARRDRSSWSFELLTKKERTTGAPPFWTEDTRHFSGGNKSVPSDELATFWLQWWADNRAKIGFASP